MKCKCPTCGLIIPCERVHNGIAMVYHAVHCGWGHEVVPLTPEELAVETQKQPIPQRDYHCWNCNGVLDARTIKREHDGTIVGTCWHCHKDCVSAIENDED